MKILPQQLGEPASWILVACAIVTTILVVRREMISDVGHLPEVRKAAFVKGWESALHSGFRVGSENAPVQVIGFTDFECPMCSRFDGTVQAVRSKHGGQVAFTFVHFPLAYHSFAEPAARAAQCAHMQGRGAEMVPLLFSKQKAFGLIEWRELARAAAVPDLDKFDSCVTSAEVSAYVSKNRKLADTLGVRGTPTIIVNGWRMPAPPTIEEFDEIVANVLRGRPPASGMSFRMGGLET